MLNYMMYLFYGEKVLDALERNNKFFTDKQRDEFRTGVYSPHLNYDKYKVIVHKPEFNQPYNIGIATHIFLDSLYKSEFLVKYVDFINEQGTPAKSQNDAKLVHIKKSDEFVPVEEFFSMKYLYGDFSRMTMYIIQKYYMKPVIYAETIDKIKEQQASCIDAALETYIRKAAIPETDMSVFEKDNFCSFIFECAERFVELYAENIILKPSCL